MTVPRLPGLFHIGWVVRDCAAAQRELGARLGGVLLELLEPLDDQSPHAEFLAARGEGLHHLAYLVQDFDDQLAAVRTARPGAELLIDGTGPGNPVRWVYLDGGAARGTVIELLEHTPQAEAVFGPALRLLSDSLARSDRPRTLIRGHQPARSSPLPGKAATERGSDDFGPLPAPQTTAKRASARR